MSELEQMAQDLMKAKYFELAPKEKYPNTEKITAELDKLEKAIRELGTK